MLNKMKLGSNSQTVNLTKMDKCVLELANRFEKKLFTAGVLGFHLPFKKEVLELIIEQHGPIEFIL